jgi:hypothetical protein
MKTVWETMLRTMVRTISWRVASAITNTLMDRFVGAAGTAIADKRCDRRGRRNNNTM